jgi:hypothetical protein
MGMAVKYVKKKVKKAVGRKKATVNWEIAAAMCRAGSFSTAICQRLGISESVLIKYCRTDNQMTFDQFRRMHFAAGNDTLHMKQYQLASEGDKTMLVWLGKNRLGQKDKIDHSTMDRPLNQPVFNVISLEQKQDVENVIQKADEI